MVVLVVFVIFSVALILCSFVVAVFLWWLSFVVVVFVVLQIPNFRYSIIIDSRGHLSKILIKKLTNGYPSKCFYS